MDEKEYQKSFALACRFLADTFGCPAYTTSADFPECSGESDKCENVDQWECWQRYFKEILKNEQVCRICGCTWNNACPGGCYWVEEDLCSACVDKTDLETKGEKCSLLLTQSNP